MIDINNIITGSNNISLRKVNVKTYGYDEIYMNKDLIESKLHQLIDQYSEIKINHTDTSNNIHPFYDGNGRTCKTLFVDNFNYGI